MFWHIRPDNGPQRLPSQGASPPPPPSCTHPAVTRAPHGAQATATPYMWRTRPKPWEVRRSILTRQDPHH